MALSRDGPRLGKKFHARGSVHGQKVTVCGSSAGLTGWIKVEWPCNWPSNDRTLQTHTAENPGSFTKLHSCQMLSILSRELL